MNELITIVSYMFAALSGVCLISGVAVLRGGEKGRGKCRVHDFDD